MSAKPAGAEAAWKERLAALMPLYGHRNWIVVADAAYPSQSKAGVETVYAGGDQVYAVQAALNAIMTSRHVRAAVYVDRELGFVTEEFAPGVNEYRKQLGALLRGAAVRELAHEEIIAKLDKAAEMFGVLVIKTDMTIPYTSVFFELDCGYWSADAETRLREAMRTGTR